MVTEEEKMIFKRHETYIQKKFAEKVLEFVGTSFEKDEEHFAIVIINAENKKEAHEIMANDPAVKNGLLISKITEFNTYLK